MERISELPDELLIRILSFLPVEEIARAKLVSKPWKNLSEFSFVPPLKFEQPRHCNGTISSFHDSIDSSIKLHYQKGLSLSRIRLCLDLDLDLIGSSRWKIDSWIDAALERKVGQLDLCFLRSSIINYYPLPDKVFAAGTITVLCLQCFRLEIPGHIDLPALRKLCLRKILCEDQAIQKLISSCPLIQELEIWSCSGKQGLHVSGLLNLQRLSVVCCYALQIIEIDASTLRYLEFHHGSLRCDLVLTFSEFLRELILRDRFITEESFQNLLSTLPNLERLEINGIQLKRIEISHRQLKRLDLTLTNTVRKLKIDTPNLQSLTYSGHRMPLVSIIPSLNTSSLHELHLCFANHNVCSHFSKDMKLHLHIKSKQVKISLRSHLY